MLGWHPCSKGSPTSKSCGVISKFLNFLWFHHGYHYDFIILVIKFDHCTGTAVGSGLALDLELNVLCLLTHLILFSR